MLKGDFNKVALLKSHFGTGVLLKNNIKTKHTEKKEEVRCNG